MTVPRHSWGEPARFLHKTERACLHCAVIKVSRHENGRHWTEYWRGLERCRPFTDTPACVPVEETEHA